MTARVRTALSPGVSTSDRVRRWLSGENALRSRLGARISPMAVSPHDIARVLSEALPHMQRYDEEIVVVKYGGPPLGPESKARRLPRHPLPVGASALTPAWGPRGG